MPVTAGHWGHLVMRPESGSRATKTPDRDPRSTQRLSQLSWNRRHLVGDWGQSWNVTVSKPGSSKLTQGQTHTQLSASLRQVILVFTVFPCIKKKKAFIKNHFHSLQWEETFGVLGKHTKVPAPRPACCGACAVPLGPGEAVAGSRQWWG